MWLIIDARDACVTGDTAEQAWEQYKAVSDTYGLEDLRFYDLGPIRPIEMRSVLVPTPDTE